MDYAQRQALIAQRAQQWLVERPGWSNRLAPEGRRKLSNVALAAVNARRLIAERWPEAVVSVRSHKHAHGTELAVCVLEFPNHPSSQEVRDALRPFVSRRWNSGHEGYDYDQDIDREGFRHAFGGCGEMSVHSLTPSPAEFQRYMQQHLARPTCAALRPRM